MEAIAAQNPNLNDVRIFLDASTTIPCVPRMACG